MAPDDALLSIGAVAERTGLAPSALRFYEREGLISAQRTDGSQRRFERDVLRRVAFIRVAQTVGLSLPEIRESMAQLPAERTPNKADWDRIARAWRPRIDDRIASLERLRDQLGECIGCGWLSLRGCALYNPEDRASRLGAGARYLLGDLPEPTD
jgi:MerR family redox-sensitive transcriptional activator SoxR